MKKFLVAYLTVFASYQTYAATFTVTNTLDAGAGSLRQAIISANANPMDADNIVFAIPTSDPNYNAVTGVYTITPASVLPTVNSIAVSIDGTTQPGNTNPNGPEICIKSTANLMYALCYPFQGGVAKGLTIQGFQYGIILTKYGSYPSGSCTVSACYIGVSYDGSMAVPNDVGVVVYGGVSGNTIKDNIISGNTLSGIGIRSSNSNIIQGNKIGCDRTGMFAIANYYGVALDSSANNTIGGNTSAQRNIISGNAYAGVAINTNISHDNNIKGNYIGINANGAARADTIANYYGIAINDSYNNIIGGAASGERNIIAGNKDGGVAVMGPAAKNNSIKGNYIGTNVSGTDSIPNSNGVLLSGASANIIGGSITGEGNVISGNTLAGIALVYSGTRLNKVIGNYIGTNFQGNQILSNHTGVYIKSNANKNTIGGAAPGERNILSGNIEMGLAIESSDSNTVQGNYIGPDITGITPLKLPNDSLVQGNGMLFNSNSKYNIAGGYNPGEGNIISGNRMYGHTYYGNSSYNPLIGNYIGVDATGNASMPNATGICLDGSAHHNPIINNVLSGNLAYGIFLVTTGSNYNEVKGNKIGTNAAGTNPVPNQVGVVIAGGAKYNLIGGNIAADRNIISGNKFNGIEIGDIYTAYNDIKGNYLGTDINGASALPNQIGISIVTKSVKNNIENNVISGNNYLGVILYEECDSNTIYSNKIGVASDGISPLKNTSGGIVIAKDSKYNKIGAINKGNIIAYHDTIGVAVIDAGTVFNTISSNEIFNNGIMDIDLYPYGVNPNDAADSDIGSNEQMNYPVIQNAYRDWSSGITSITGIMDCSTYGGPSGIKIELFKSNGSNMFNHGGATAFLGDTVVINSSGNWSFTTSALGPADMITATATDIQGNTSEFAQNFGITVEVSENNSSDDYAIYPNPAADIVCISMPQSEKYTLLILDVFGKKLFQSDIEKDTSCIDISKFDNGIYLFQVMNDADVKIVSKKFIIGR